MSESKLKSGCDHKDVDLDCTATSLTGTDVVMVAVAAQCRHCKRRFKFIGDLPAVASIEQPSRTEDLRMVLLPMQPEPKAPFIMPGVN